MDVVYSLNRCFSSEAWYFLDSFLTTFCQILRHVHALDRLHQFFPEIEFLPSITYLKLK